MSNRVLSHPQMIGVRWLLRQFSKLLFGGSKDLLEFAVDQRNGARVAHVGRMTRNRNQSLLRKRCGQIVFASGRNARLHVERMGKAHGEFLLVDTAR